MAKNEIKYLTAIKADNRPKKYCRFKKMGIRYIDYKDPEFLKKFLNEPDGNFALCNRSNEIIFFHHPNSPRRRKL